MKYGETLRQRSIAAWSHHNIDYDDIKRFIKEETTPGKGKSVSVPGRTDDKLLDFETALFNVLSEQHHRIDLFVRSKAGEIQRRLDHSKKQLRQLSARNVVTTDQRVSLSRLERYGRLESDVLKAGEEIKSLARFTSTQRTAFRKLLKKFKKWTGSSNLDDRFQDEILSDTQSFTNIDLGALLDDYSDTLVAVRELYENHVRQPTYRKADLDAAPLAGSSVIARLQTAIASGSKVEFDTAVGAVPLGEAGTFASYFVHPDCIVELLMLLLNHTRSYSAKSRQNSLNSPARTSRKSSTPTGQGTNYEPDYFAIAADDLERFVNEQSSLTIDDREHGPGASPQSVRLCARWNNDEDAQVCARSSRGSTRCAPVKRKHIDTFFDSSVKYPVKKDQDARPDADDVREIRAEVEKDNRIRALYKMSACRSRFVGLNNTDKGAVLATLDTSLTFRDLSSNTDADKDIFPFAILSVREEGIVSAGLLTALADSHLVERVRGFSIELHGVWEVRQPKAIPAPFWIPILSRDIRKLPPPAMNHRGSSSAEASSSLSATQASESTNSGRQTTDSNTALDTGLDTPGLQGSFDLSKTSRKKRPRVYPEPIKKLEQKYWNEYDHPEDGDERDAYVIYIDPNETSTLDRIVDKISNLFTRAKTATTSQADSESPSTPHDEDSSDEESGLLNTKSTRPTYGTLQLPFSTNTTTTPSNGRPWSGPPSPEMILPCYVAATTVLIVAYFLAITGRRKLHAEVELGVFFAIFSSIFFAMMGFIALCRQPTVQWSAWVLASALLIFEAVGSGGLLAWMFGSTLVNF